MLCQREEREAGRAYPRTCPTCRLGPCQKFGAKPLQSLSDDQAEIARLTAERDQALARVAAAAMEMRERAATHTQWTAWGERHVLTEAARRAIRILPIDPDAQKALDKMLAKAREDAIREAASVSGHYLTTEADELLADMWREDILALLNDGGRDE